MLADVKFPSSIVQHQSQATSTPKPRLYFVGNVRIALTLLVIVQHMIVAYGGGSGKWYITDPVKANGLSWYFLTIIWLINQSFLMGFFFFISAYSVPQSYRRKGLFLFVRERLMRLGIPLAAYVIIVNPVLSYITWTYKGAFDGSFFEFLATYLNGYKNLDVGVLWFIELLLLLTLAYSLLRAARGVAGRLIRLSRLPMPRMAFRISPDFTILCFAFILAFVTAIDRIFLYGDTSLRKLGIPSEHIVPYVLLFAVGVLVSNQNLSQVHKRLNYRFWKGMTVVLLSMLPFLLTFMDLKNPPAIYLAGWGLSWQHILLYTFWEQLFCVSIIVFLLCFAEARLDFPSRISMHLERFSYSTYLVHAPIITLFIVLMSGLTIDPLSKFFLSLFLGIPCTLFCAAAIKNTRLGRMLL